jgi:hypothetical protein
MRHFITQYDTLTDWPSPKKASKRYFTELENVTIPTNCGIERHAAVESFAAHLGDIGTVLRES